MRGSRLRKCGFIAASVLFVFLFLPTSVLYSRIKPAGFPIPLKILPLGQAVTPREYAQLRQAVIVNWQREKAGILARGPALGMNFTHIIAARVRLGALGEGLVVEFAHSPQCGATGNCPMAVYVRGPNGYRRMISAGGWGYALLPSGGPVPDVATYGHISAGETATGLFHYVRGHFVLMKSPMCTGKSTSAICAAIDKKALSSLGNAGWGQPVTPADYDALRPVVTAAFQKQLAASRIQTQFADSHAMDFQTVNRVMATAVGLGRCNVSSNCGISIYAHYYHGHYWPLLENASGWGVVRVRESNHAGGLRSAFVIARRLSPRKDELIRYSVAIFGQGGNLRPAGRLLPEACEIVTPKAGRWPAQWDAAALVARPVSCFKPPAASVAEIPAEDTTRIQTVVQDSRGTIWGIHQGFFGHLYRWRNGGWIVAPTPEQVASLASEAAQQMQGNELIPRPIGLWKGPDGGVLVRWRLKVASPKSVLVWQRGDQTKILAQPSPPGQPGPLGRLHIKSTANAPLGTILIAENGGATYRNGVPMHPAVQALYRIGVNQPLQQIYTISPDQYMRIRFRRARRPLTRFLPLHTTRDAQGKVWIWYGWQGFGLPGRRVMQGFLVTDGKTVTYHRNIPGMRLFRLARLDVWDQQHLVAATIGQGLYTINTSTLIARHIAEPQPGAFFFVKKVFRVGADHYVLTSGPGTRLRLRPEYRAFLTGALWRLHDGQWKEIATGLGDASGNGLATPQGLWLARSRYHGLWFVPPNGPARRIDWHEGLPLATLNQMFRLPDGDIMATGGRSVEFHPASMLARRPKPRGFSVLHLPAGLEADRRHNLWALLPHGVLSQWNGSRWIDHRLPAALKPERIIGLDVDTEGRVWLFPGCHLGPMAFFDIDKNHWSSYDSYPDALAARVHPVEFLHPKDDPMRPIYGPHSQIVFVGKCGAVNYFNGSAWQTFEWRMLPRNRNIAIPPFFDSAGHLALNINHTTWQWTPEARWQETSETPPQNYVRMLPNPFAPPPAVPEGCQSPYPSWLVKDPLGQSWWVADDALYEGTPGKCRVVLSGAGRQPFIDGRRLVAAKVGPRGNAFLKTLGPSSYIMVPRSTYAGASAARR